MTRHEDVCGQACLHLQDGIFSASYSGATQPFSPAAFLHAWWRHADHHLASYQQQDAHEFYLYALAGLGQSWLRSEEEAMPASAPAPVQEMGQQQQLLLQMKQEPGMAIQAAGQLLQQRLPQKQEPKEEDCLLVPSQHALHACLAEPLHRGTHTSTSMEHCVAGPEKPHQPLMLTMVLISLSCSVTMIVCGTANCVHRMKTRTSHMMIVFHITVTCAGLVTRGHLGNQLQASHVPNVHSSGPIPLRHTNGHTPTSGDPQAARLDHNMATPNPFTKGSFGQHDSSAPHQRPVHQYGMGLPPYSCHTPHQDGRSGTPGGSPLPNIGQGQDTSLPSRQPGQPGPQEPSSQRQGAIPGHQVPHHGMQHSASLQYSSGYPQSHGSGMQQAAPWQQQQQRTLTNQHPNHSGQQLHSSGLQQSMPEPANSGASRPRQGQQPSMLGGQRAPHIKQEGPGVQQNSHALSQAGTWQLRQQSMAAQQGQVPYQHPQSMAGTSHSQPQRQSDSHGPSSLPIPQGANQLQQSDPASYSLPRLQEGSQARPLTIQQQFQALQEDSQPLGHDPEPLPNGSAQNQPTTGSSSQPGSYPLRRT